LPVVQSAVQKRGVIKTGRQAVQETAIKGESLVCEGVAPAQLDRMPFDPKLALQQFPPFRDRHLKRSQLPRAEACLRMWAEVRRE
jgi:hypothetical protein